MFLQKLKNFKNSVALFWRLSCGSSKSHAIAASSHVDFGDLFASERSSYEGCIEIFAAQLATPSRVDPSSRKKHLENLFTILTLRVLVACPGNLFQLRKTRVLRFKYSFFKFFKFFPRLYVTVHCLPHFFLN